MERLIRKFEDEEVDEIRAERRQRTLDLIRSVKSAVRKMGNFSVVAKIPRHGKKSSAWFCNVSPDNWDIIPDHVETFEHSFECAKPRTSMMPIKASLRRPPENATDDENMKYNRTIDEIRRIIGVFFNASGDSSPTGLKLIEKARKQI